MDWFTTDKAGLASLLDRRGRHRVLLEPVSNALDEDGVSTVAVELRPVEGRRGAFVYSIEDDSLTGFRRLSDAWTMFASSYKKGDVTKRGRFNLGEKLFLSICESASIASVTGSVTFDADGRHTGEAGRDRGSRFEAVVLMTKQDAERGVALIRTMLVPEGVKVTLNGERLEPRTPVHRFEATLPTEFQDGQGQWRHSARRTAICLHQPAEGEKPHVYEMGIPVVREHGGRWHVDVAQKVPLNTDRDNITPAYLRQLREAVLNNSHDLIDDEDANSRWVKDALPNATPEALSTVLDLRFGDKRVVADPSDPEANKLAAAAGYTVIGPRSFSRGEWDNIRAHDLVKPAGQVTPSNGKVQFDQAGKSIAEADWRPGMRRVAAYAVRAAELTLGVAVTVSFHTPPLTEAWAAAYGGRRLSFNLTRLGYRWFEEPDEAKVDALLIHELAHETQSDHLDHRYHDALCDLGAAFKAHAPHLALGRVSDQEGRLGPSRSPEPFEDEPTASRT